MTHRRAARSIIVVLATSAVCAFVACSSDPTEPVCPAGLVDMGGPQSLQMVPAGCTALDHQCYTTGGNTTCYYEICCPPVPDASDEGGDAPSE